jgi:hypothetical protein
MVNQIMRAADAAKYAALGIADDKAEYVSVGAAGGTAVDATNYAAVDIEDDTAKYAALGGVDDKAVDAANSAALGISVGAELDAAIGTADATNRPAVEATNRTEVGKALDAVIVTKVNAAVGATVEAWWRQRAPLRDFKVITYAAKRGIESS